jgi:hypothetical protein
VYIEDILCTSLATALSVNQQLLCREADRIRNLNLEGELTDLEVDTMCRNRCETMPPMPVVAFRFCLRS